MKKKYFIECYLRGTMAQQILESYLFRFLKVFCQHHRSSPEFHRKIFQVIHLPFPNNCYEEFKSNLEIQIQKKKSSGCCKQHKLLLYDEESNLIDFLRLRYIFKFYRTTSIIPKNQQNKIVSF